MRMKLKQAKKEMMVKLAPLQEFKRTTRMDSRVKPEDSVCGHSRFAVQLLARAMYL
jgi:hypothetical protein